MDRYFMAMEPTSKVNSVKTSLTDLLFSDTPPLPSTKDRSKMVLKME